MGYLQGIQERVRNSRGTRAISVRASEGLLYMFLLQQSVELKLHMANTCGFK